MYGKINVTDMKDFHRRSLRVISQATLPPIKRDTIQLHSDVTMVFRKGR
jgi:hypothetical protein